MISSINDVRSHDTEELLLADSHKHSEEVLQREDDAHNNNSGTNNRANRGHQDHKYCDRFENTRPQAQKRKAGLGKFLNIFGGDGDYIRLGFISVANNHLFVGSSGKSSFDLDTGVDSHLLDTNGDEEQVDKETGAEDKLVTLKSRAQPLGLAANEAQNLEGKEPNRKDDDDGPRACCHCTILKRSMNSNWDSE
jgi:hypothetical protein